MFEVFEIDKDTWQIRESNFVNMYLLAGSKRALLIDTGNGSLRLPEIIGTILLSSGDFHHLLLLSYLAYHKKT